MYTGDSLGHGSQRNHQGGGGEVTWPTYRQSELAVLVPVITLGLSTPKSRP